MKTSQLQEQLKIEKDDFELIKGKFSPEDALDILNNLIQRKIDYHNLKGFSHYERFGVKNQWSEQRIEELRKSLEAMQAFILRAKEQGSYLNINSSISIEVIPS